LYTFDFDNGDTEPYILTGTRVLAFPFPHNYVDGFKESFIWKTNVLIASSLREQRIPLRRLPKHQVSISFLTGQVPSRHLDSLLFGWQKQVFAVPMWNYRQDLASPLIAGSSVIPYDTDGRPVGPD